LIDHKFRSSGRIGVTQPNQNMNNAQPSSSKVKHNCDSSYNPERQFESILLMHETNNDVLDPNQVCLDSEGVINEAATYFQTTTEKSCSNRESLGTNCNSSFSEFKPPHMTKATEKGCSNVPANSGMHKKTLQPTKQPQQSNQTLALTPLKSRHNKHCRRTDRKIATVLVGCYCDRLLLNS